MFQAFHQQYKWLIALNCLLVEFGDDFVLNRFGNPLFWYPHHIYPKAHFQEVFATFSHFICNSALNFGVFLKSNEITLNCISNFNQCLLDQVYSQNVQVTGNKYAIL